MDSIIPHARVRIYANTTELIGDEQVTLGYEPSFPLKRPLTAADKLTATQQAFGFVSAHTTPPVDVLPQSQPLTAPVIDPRLFDCGRVVDVTNLNPSTHVEVYSSQTLPVPIDSAHLIGTAECTGASVPVVTQPLKQGWHVAARQISCPGTPREIRSNASQPQTVAPDPDPMVPPVMDPPIVGNDVVILHGLYVGAAINITDSTAP
ncbi:MAG: hypothetical protein JO262_18765, partial [Solirubrobacterales bacterium]|nr:hypothetical protein [Solirubrobacterales bacterium]